MRYITIFLVFSIIIIFETVYGSYRATSLPERIARSQLILKGTISSVNESTYSLSIERVLKGDKLKGDTVAIYKFKDWTCATRGETYASGQHLIVFLTETTGTPGVYVGIGSGNEGEARIVNGEAYVKYVQGNHYNCLKTQHGKVSGAVLNVSHFESIITLLKPLLSYDSETAFYNSDIATLSKILEDDDRTLITLISETKIITPAISEDFLLNYTYRNDCPFYKFASSVIEHQSLTTKRLSPVLVSTLKFCKDDLQANMTASRLLGELGQKAHNLLPDLRNLASSNKDTFIRKIIENEALQPISNGNQTDM